MRLTVKEWRATILPMLQAQAKDAAAFTKSSHVFIDENEIVDENGEPVVIETIELTTAPPGEDEGAEVEVEPEGGGGPAAPTQASLTAAFRKALREDRKEAGAANKVMNVKVGKELLEDDPKRGHKNFGEFAKLVTKSGDPHNGQHIKAITGAGQLIGADGGFLVPPEFSTIIWDGLNQEADNLLSATDSYTITGESLTFNANAETSRATGSRWGGVRAYWLAEAAEMTASQPKWRQIKLEKNELGVFVYVTDKLLSNASVALEQYLSRAATEEINWLVSDSIINGTGAGKPLGLLNSNALISVLKENGQPAATVNYENISNMWERLHIKSRANAVWYIHQRVEKQLQRMQIGTGTTAQLVYMPPGGISGQQFGTIFGRPVMPIEYCQDLGTKGDVVLADLKAYASGSAGSVDSEMSIHLRFNFNESVFRFLFSVDGQPWINSAITPANGTTTTSPFVTLDTRS